MDCFVKLSQEDAKTTATFPGLRESQRGRQQANKEANTGMSMRSKAVFFTFVNPFAEHHWQQGRQRHSNNTGGKRLQL